MSLLVPTCTCCGSELINPTIINGKLYGYTCAAKIKGGKQARKYKYVQAKEVKKLLTEKGYHYASMLLIEGKQERRNIDAKTNQFAFSEVINGNLYVRIPR